MCKQINIFIWKDAINYRNVRIYTYIFNLSLDHIKSSTTFVVITNVDGSMK
jgi:hypothetical protein